MEKSNVKPFGMKDKIGYMFGDFGNDFTFVLSTFLIVNFIGALVFSVTAYLYLKNKGSGKIIGKLMMRRKRKEEDYLQ